MQPINHAPIEQFGVQGIVLDIPETGRTFQQLNYATNTRCQDREIATIPAAVEELALDAEKTPAHAHPFWMSDDSGGHVICYTDGTIEYVNSAREVSDVTPTVAPSPSDYWYAAQINNMFVLTNGIDAPWQWTQDQALSATPLEPMKNWDSTYRARIIEAYKSHLVAGDIRISGAERRSLIKWSHPLSPGDDQFFWDHTDTTLLAGENELAVAGRSINGLQPLRDNCVIYFDKSVWRMTYVGGTFVMSFSRIFSDDGTVGPHAHCDIDGHAIVVGYRDIYTHDGFNKRSLSDGKVTDWFYSNALLSRGMQAMLYTQRREVWMSYPTRSELDDYNLALIYNVDRGSFTTMRMDGPNNLGSARHLYMGPQFSDEAATRDYDTAEESYNDSTDASYNILGRSDVESVFYKLSGEEKNLQLMDTARNTCHDPANVFIEVSKTKLEHLFPTTGDKIRYISRLFPRMTGAGSVEVSLGVGMTPTAPVEWKPWVKFNLQEDHALDFRAAGRYVGLRIKLPAGEVSQFSITGFDIEVMTPHAGRR